SVVSRRRRLARPRRGRPPRVRGARAAPPGPPPGGRPPRPPPAPPFGAAGGAAEAGDRRSSGRGGPWEQGARAGGGCAGRRRERCLEARPRLRRDGVERDGDRPRLEAPGGELGRAVPAREELVPRPEAPRRERRRLERPASPGKPHRAVVLAAMGQRR